MSSIAMKVPRMAGRAGRKGAKAWFGTKAVKSVARRRRGRRRQPLIWLAAAGGAVAAVVLKKRRGEVKGAVHAAAPTTDSSTGQLNDPALARKVESEIFRDADAPKGEVNVNVEHGVVYLRGQLDGEEGIEKLVSAAREVDGVKDVRSLLHTPGTPAPAKEDGR